VRDGLEGQYFISSTLSMVDIGVALIAIPWFIRF
jgi:hypothetical protein